MSTTVDGSAGRRPASTTKLTPPAYSSAISTGSSIHVAASCGSRTDEHSSGRGSRASIAAHTGSAGRRTPTDLRTLSARDAKLVHCLGSFLEAGRMKV